jgi:predicted nucleotidyltransferase
MTGMRNELSKMFGRDVDIVIRESLPRANPLRRQAIESEAKVIYEVA